MVLPTQNIFLAASWMVAALTSFVVIAIGARELSHDLHTFQILLIRSAIGVTFISLLLTKHGWHRSKTTKVGLHSIRNISHFIGQFGWFYAIGFIPLSAVFAIEMTTPLWTAFWALLFLGEKFTRPRLLAIVIGMLGLMVILRPGASVLHPAALIVLVSAMLYGITHTVTKKLSATESSITILFYMMLMQFLMALLPALYFWQSTDIYHWPWLLLIGFAGLSAHYCLIKALLYADAMVVIPMDFLRLPMVSLVAYLLYEERVDQNLIAGALFIVCGVLINLKAEKNR